MAVLSALNLAYQLADRPLAPPSPAVAKTPAPAARHNAADDVQIDTLIARIDTAMGSDGYLL